MTRNDDERLSDIIDAARQVAEIADAGRDLFDRDRVRQLAIERLLEIIGEAARAMSEQRKSLYPEVPWADIVGLRTLLAHHYHRTDPAQVWVVATQSVPSLLAALGPPPA